MAGWWMPDGQLLILAGNEHAELFLYGDAKGRFFIGTDEKKLYSICKSIIEKGIHYALSSGCRWS